ncbi:hypothetical protein DPMN_025819 [Dreissena polymorpha]|uniref:Uncharacterized protein n=1 Tax=Dreissena polymorpha TaxID=45954 RepID=A0A9D4RC66_DREPO|nr:hypothetical protein DPMN_025819 [Dreissena polymorpha]
MVHLTLVLSGVDGTEAAGVVMEPQDIVKRRVFDDNGDGTIGYRIYVIDGNGKATRVC